MKLKQLILSVLLILLSLSIFFSCDKVEEPYFKPVYTDRYVLTELIADAQTLNSNIYSDFTTLCSGNSLSIPMLVLSGDTSVLGNSIASKQITNQFKLGTNDSLIMINRSSYQSNIGIAYNLWESALQSESNKKGEFNIETEGQLEYTTNLFTGTYSVSSLNGYSNSLSVSIYVLEDSLLVNGVKTMNVLRDAQENIALAPKMQRSESISKSFSCDLSSFKKLNRIKLLFVLKDTHTEEVLQLAQQSIQGIEFYKKQKILVEDFTGHKCGNCPPAHEELASLQNVYGAQVIPMAIHFGYYAETDNNYTTDFTTSAGTSIGNYFNVVSTPKGMVNRTGDEGSKLLSSSAWDAAISQLTSNTPSIGIAIDAQIVSNTIEAKVYVKAFEQNDTLMKIQVFILENGIIDKQLYYGHDPEDIEDYEHEHVLRASINGDWGEDLTEAPFKKDKLLRKTYSYSLNSDWNPSNLMLVVIVYNDITKTISQVEELHLQ